MITKLDNKKLEKIKKLLAKHGQKNPSDEEIFEISKNIQNLADVIINFESNKTVKINKK